MSHRGNIKICGALRTIPHINMHTNRIFWGGHGNINIKEIPPLGSMEKDALSLVKDEFYPLKKEKGHIYELISGKRGLDIEIQINIFLESSQFTPSK